MLKFTISVSNLCMKPIWATFEFFTCDNHHMEVSLPKYSKTYSIVHIGFQGILILGIQLFLYLSTHSSGPNQSLSLISDFLADSLEADKN